MKTLFLPIYAGQSINSVKIGTISVHMSDEFIIRVKMLSSLILTLGLKSVQLPTTSGSVNVLGEQKDNKILLADYPDVSSAFVSVGADDFHVCITGRHGDEAKSSLIDIKNLNNGFLYIAEQPK